MVSVETEIPAIFCLHGRNSYPGDIASMFSGEQASGGAPAATCIQQVAAEGNRAVEIPDSLAQCLCRIFCIAEIAEMIVQVITNNLFPKGNIVLRIERIKVRQRISIILHKVTEYLAAGQVKRIERKANLPVVLSIIPRNSHINTRQHIHQEAKDAKCFEPNW